MSLSLIEAKNEVAKIYGYFTWLEYLEYMVKDMPPRYQVVNDQVAELYAKSRAMAYSKWLENNAAMNRNDEQLYQSFLDSTI